VLGDKKDTFYKTCDELGILLSDDDDENSDDGM